MAATVWIDSTDGARLAATPHAAADPARAIVIAPATGVPQELYRGFAQFAADQGINAYTFDFRGVAASRPPRLRGFEAGFAQWAEDIDAVIAHALARHLRVSVIGHSVGGLLAPVAERATQLHRLVLVGAQTAYWRDWRWRDRLPMALLWHGLMPLATAVAGYFPGRALRLGEDLPRRVALQWSSRPWSDPFGAGDAWGPPGLLRRRYARALPPVHLAAAVDDAFATPPALARVQAQLTGSTVVRHAWRPADLGLRRLGHFDPFRRRAAALWPQLLALAMPSDPTPRNEETS